MKGRSVNYIWSWSPFCLLSLPPNPPFLLLQTTSLDFSCGRTLRGKQSFTYLAVLILALIPKESVAVPLDWPLVQYSTIGKLRSIFNSIGRSGDWSGLSPGNPVAHPSAKKYLASISESYLSRMRKPCLLSSSSSLSCIITYVIGRFYHPYPPGKVPRKPDLAFFCLDFYSGDRACDRGRVYTK